MIMAPIHEKSPGSGGAARGRLNGSAKAKIPMERQMTNLFENFLEILKKRIIEMNKPAIPIM